MTEDRAATNILERWYAGDESAFAELLDAHGEWLREHVRRRMGRKLRANQDSGDVVQDVLVDLLRNGPAFVPANDRQLRALLARMVCNRLADLADYAGAVKRCRDMEVVLDSRFVSRIGPQDASALRPSRIAEAEEEKARVRVALELLEPADQHVIWLHRWMGKPFAEIAEELSIETKAANKRYQRAVLRLGREVRRLESGEVEEVIENEGS